MSAKSMLLKEEGNRHFQTGDYAGADGLYSKAIIQDPRNATLYTNRAMARLKLDMWDSVISDCRTCLELSPGNMKAYYYLSQARLAMGDHDEALADARRAYDLCVLAGDKSLQSVTTQVLRCKKERWETVEKRRVRQGNELEIVVKELMKKERDEALRDIDGAADRKEIADEWDSRVDQIQAIFDKARAADGNKVRTVPDWAIDDISFGIMVDPVITRTGKSYERASIMEHLRRQSIDPLTRDPLYPSDLRPNLGLKQACDEFLDENGWAVDW